MSNKDELKLDGSNYAIYWSDLSSELLMLVPSAINTAKRMASRGSLGSGRDRTFSSPKDMPEPQRKCN